MEPKLYHQLWIHREMLRDRVRCDAYRSAIFRLVRPGAVVLDVGTGTGIMAMFAAQAGARRVYAVERTQVADVAEDLIRKNGLARKVKVIRGDMTRVRIPEKVDVLISEWMGGFGVDENLADPVLRARDRWLKPGGIMIPDTVEVWMAPVRDVRLRDAVRFWSLNAYGVDLGLLGRYMACEVYNARHDLRADSLIAAPTLLWTFDTGAMPRAAAASAFKADFRVVARKSARLNALAAWFHADFKCGVTLTNAPEAPGTHWGRTMLPLPGELAVRRGSEIHVRFACIPVAPNLCDNVWKVRVDGGPWLGSGGRQGCTASLGFG